MAVESKITLKTYFETGDVPTEAQFESFIDTVIVHPVAVIFNVSATIVVAGGVYLQRIIIIGEPGGIGLTVGLTPGGSDYYGGGWSSGVPLVIEIGQYFTVTTSIYIAGGNTGMTYKSFLQ